MSRERYESPTARLAGRIQSALNRGRQQAEQRRLAHETGHVDHPDILPADEPHVVFDANQAECLDTRVFSDQVAMHNDVYNQSITQQWEQADPAEDYKPDVISRIGPSF